jgi:hypothetical protein
LLDANGEELIRNSFFNFVSALIVIQLPEDGNYTLLAQRYDGEEGDTAGPYWLKASFVEPLTRGASATATLNSESDEQETEYYIIAPEEDGAYTFNISFADPDLYPDVSLNSYTGDWLEDEALFSLTKLMGDIPVPPSPPSWKRVHCMFWRLQTGSSSILAVPRLPKLLYLWNNPP